MKAAIFSDIHGNIHFFNACLNIMKMHQVDTYFFLGDAVGYMPHCMEVFDILEALNSICLLGNHEAMLCGILEYTDTQDEVYQIRRVSSKNHSLINKIKYWLPFHITAVDEIKMLFVHGTPWDPIRGYMYPDSTWKHYNNPQFDFIFLAHSHRPFISNNNHTTVVNVGSCGLPRDIGNSPSFVIFDTLTKKVEIIRLQLDIQALLMEFEIHGVHKDVLHCLMRKGEV
jgi:predicted phosphodiesterase